jgi:hypothetical protein
MPPNPYMASDVNTYMASDVNRRTANGGRFFSFRGVITGPQLTAALRATPRASAHGVSTKLHQTLIQGSATEPLSAARRLRGVAPRPRNAFVPPRRPVKALGSRPQGRSQLGNGSAGGQPRGEGATVPVPDRREGRWPCRGRIQARGSGPLAQRCRMGSVVPRRWQRRGALARCCWPQFGR